MTNESRFLRSKRLRASLWYAADGKCQRCGCDLPSDWHADHIFRWAETCRTNVHEMQALCPKCHYEKTASENRNMTDTIQFDLFAQPPKEPLNLRKHQAEFLKICKRIKAGEPINKILMLVTPGGGKSLIPVIAAAQLLPNQASGGGFQGTIADKVCWVVPRINLQEQAEKNFDDPYFRELLGHQNRIRANNNKPDQSRSMAGYVVTYQAVSANPTLHAHELERKRYILVLDEFHHAWEGGSWHQALQPLVDNAVLVILVTGTDERGDGKPIAFMPYKAIDGGITPNWSDSTDRRVIRYTRGDALREGAIVPLHFELQDGEAKWIDKAGQDCAVESLAEAGGDTSAAIYTALNTDFAYQVLIKCVDHWKAHKATNPRAKLLVLAPSIPKADQYLKWLQEVGIIAVKATSDESREAQEAIRRFKKYHSKSDSKTPDAVDALVTVAMAYEGLDVPAITHIACLTHIRSTPWLEQAWARAARVDREAGSKKDIGVIFVPDDELARSCIEKILQEQDPILREREQRRREGSKGGQDDNSSHYRDNSIIPLSSDLTRSRALDLSNGETVDYDQTAIILLAAQQVGIGESTIKLKRFLDLCNIHQVEKDFSSVAVGKEESLTASQEENLIRQKIENYVRYYASKNPLLSPHLLNSEIVKQFGKKREVMTPQELRQVWAWLQKNYQMTD